ncbi:MAG: polymer-forming cytoskeletal protein [Pseudomonadota bacterium]
MSGQFNKMFKGGGSRGDERAPENKSAAEETHPPRQSAADEAAVSIERGQQGAPVSMPAPPSSMDSYFGAGCIIEGKVTCKGPIRLGGQVTGDVTSDDEITVDETAEVSANLYAARASVSGRINGNVTATSRLMLAASARIEGDIRTPSLAIAEGAQIRGRVEVAPNTSAPPASVRPAPASADVNVGMSAMGRAKTKTRDGVIQDAPASNAQPTNAPPAFLSGEGDKTSIPPARPLRLDEDD